MPLSRVLRIYCARPLFGSDAALVGFFTLSPLGSAASRTRCLKAFSSVVGSAGDATKAASRPPSGRHLWPREKRSTCRGRRDDSPGVVCPWLSSPFAGGESVDAITRSVSLNGSRPITLCGRRPERWLSCRERRPSEIVRPVPICVVCIGRKRGQPRT